MSMPGGIVAIVTGSRHGPPRETPSGFVHNALDKFERDFGRIAVLIEGGCRQKGYVTIDQLAAQWAMVRERAFMTVPAPWDSWEQWGLPSRNAAGPERNGWMHDLACQLAPRAMNRRCLAFPGGNGTASMVSIARDRGTIVKSYQYGATGMKWGWRDEP